MAMIKMKMPDDSARNKRRLVASTGAYGVVSSHNGERKYPSSSTASMPLTKTSQFSGSAASVVFTQPMFFSPLHTPQNWQIASKRREIYTWCRFYYENEPKVAAGVDFYSQFPMNGFKLECKSKRIIDFFEEVVEDLDLEEWLDSISHEYFLLGDVFPFLEIDCKTCHGSGIDPETGEQCNHPGGEFKSIRVLNPDYIEVQDNVLTDEPLIALVPDEELQMIVQRKQPEHIYNKLPINIINLIATGRPITLSNRSISHLKLNASGYSTYGSSMLRRLFTMLAYKTKLMTANWIIAERLIIPVRVVKVGDEKRPASEDDIQDVVNQLAAVSNDPNLTIVTHHAFCHDKETEVLTDDGWKKFDELNKTERVMTFNPETERCEYHEPLAYHEFDYDGEMIGFENNKTNLFVTPNHRILGYKRNKKQYYVETANEFAERKECDRYIRTVADYHANDLDFINLCGYRIATDDFMKFAGYYISEGYSVYNTSRRDYRVSVSQSKTANPHIYDDIDGAFSSLDIKFHKYEYDGKATSWVILKKDITKQIISWFGHNSYQKKIPSFIKNLPPYRLRILIDSYNNGDASWSPKENPFYVQDGTVSKQLADDLQEIMFKAGLTPTKSKFRKDNQYMVNCNITKNGKGRFTRIKPGHVRKEHYNGKVWCLTTSTGFFVTRRKGHIAISGNSYEFYGATSRIHNIAPEIEQIGKEILDGLMLNQALLNGEMSSYSSAAVGIETLIRRLDNWRNKLKKWVEKKIFLPISMMQGFFDEEKSKRRNKEVYLYPKLKWNDLNLRDNTQKVQLLLQMHDKGMVASQTILEEINLDYDSEVERMREEQIMATQSGMIMPGMEQGGMGGPLGAMGGMGGPPMGGLPGEMPGGEMGGMGGMGGVPGGEMGGMGGGGMGGMPPGGGGAPMGAAAGGPPPTRISKRGKAGQQEEQQIPVPKTIKLTKLEAKMYKTLMDMNIPYKLFGQYTIHLPGQTQPFLLDFAYPEIGVAIESDGSIWHDREDFKKRDQNRDHKLANVGWRILRFNEEAINDHIEAVTNVIYKNVVDASKELRKKSEDKDAVVKFASLHNAMKNPNTAKELLFNIEDIGNEIGYIISIGD